MTARLGELKLLRAHSREPVVDPSGDAHGVPPLVARATEWTGGSGYKSTEVATPVSSDAVHAKLVALLTAEGAEFELTHHAPVRTSAEAAAVRGADLRSGAKAMLVKAQTGLVLVVLAADRKVDWKLLAPLVGGKGARFATDDELRRATGLSKGAIPPLGLIFGLRTIYDRSLLEVETVNFNAGTHTDSVTMARDDLIRIGGGEVAAFSTS